MKVPYNVIHITTTDEEIIKGENRNDWNYYLWDSNWRIRIGKLYRSRSAAARAANKIANKIEHWYPI